MRFLAVLVSVAALVVGGAARADQVRFTGHTTVDATVIRDALQNILRVAAAGEQCNQLSAVEAHILPADYRPPPAYRVAPDARYERWDATLCGRVVPFLLGFWSAPQGGTMFQVGYPFPTDPGPTPR